jgi:hypothetical protein
VLLKKVSQKREERKNRVHKKQRTSEKNPNNFVLRVVAELFSFHIQVNGNLDSNNTLSFEHIPFHLIGSTVALLVATYSST